ncbi:MAG TPA: hypothetical protein PLW01_07665 [Agitococcus sp.]|nr:hypothetical protein [Agitococcus sp.]
MFKLLNLIFLSLFCANIHAHQEIYYGAWAGTIGKNKVQVCLAKYGAQYYYLRHKVGISLELDENNPIQWFETVKNRKTWDWDKTGSWTLDKITNNQIQGQWTSPNATQQELINLARIGNLEDDICPSIFYQPIENSLNFQYGKDKFGQVSFKTIITKTGTAFEVPDSAKNSKKINAFIMEWLKEQAVAGYDCQLNGGGGWSKELRPILWTKKWLVLIDILPDTYCGGAHGGWSIDHHTFNLTTGKKVNVATWFNQKVNYEPNNDTKSAFTQLIEKLNPRDDCDSPMGLNEPYPLLNGLVFPTSYSHAERACEDEIFISYKDLQPYLSKEGKAAIATIIENK